MDAKNSRKMLLASSEHIVESWLTLLHLEGFSNLPQSSLILTRCVSCGEHIRVFVLYEGSLLLLNLNLTYWSNTKWSWLGRRCDGIIIFYLVVFFFILMKDIRLSTAVSKDLMSPCSQSLESGHLNPQLSSRKPVCRCNLDSLFQCKHAPQSKVRKAHHKRPTWSPPAWPFGSHSESYHPCGQRDARGRRWFLKQRQRRKQKEKS